MKTHAQANGEVVAAAWPEPGERSEEKGLQRDAAEAGVLVLAPPLHIVYMSQSACRLLHGLNAVAPDRGASPSAVARGWLPSPLFDVCQQVFRQLHDHPEAADRDLLEVVVVSPSTAGGLVRCRIFGIPGPRGSRQGRVMVLVEATPLPSPRLGAHVPEQVTLTRREADVVRGLANGWTNKEIAQALGLAVPTVKEHLRHIMEKTRTTTRTGILAHLLAPADLAHKPTHFFTQ